MDLVPQLSTEGAWGLQGYMHTFSGVQFQYWVLSSKFFMCGVQAYGISVTLVLALRVLSCRILVLQPSTWEWVHTKGMCGIWALGPGT